jgi:hypothetical protein
MAAFARYHHPLAAANAPACACPPVDLSAGWAPGGMVRYRIKVDGPAQLHGY